MVEWKIFLKFINKIICFNNTPFMFSWLLARLCRKMFNLCSLKTVPVFKRQSVTIRTTNTGSKDFGCSYFSGTTQQLISLKGWLFLEAMNPSQPSWTIYSPTPPVITAKSRAGDSLGGRSSSGRQVHTGWKTGEIT